MRAEERLVGEGACAVRIRWNEDGCELRTCDHVIQGNRDFGCIIRAWVDGDPGELALVAGVSFAEALQQIDVTREELARRGIRIPWE